MSHEHRILGLDYGSRRIGVALSDALGIVAQPVKTIVYNNSDDLWPKLDAVRNSYSISAIVLGMPLNMDGSKSATLKDVESFGRELKKRYSIPVEYWDERLSSQAAEKTIRTLGKKPSRIKEQIDKMAAVWILQGYLDRLYGQSRAFK